MTNKKKYAGRLVLQLTKAQVLLAVYGARETQENPKLDFSHTAHQALSEVQCMLTHTGAKMYRLGGGWWHLLGYGFQVTSKMPERFKTLRVDECDTLRTLGFAV